MGLAGGEDIEDALWLIKTGDSEVGPVSTDEMVAMIEAGEVSARTLVKTLDGPQRWFRVDETALYGLTIPSGVRERPVSKAWLGLVGIVAFVGWSYYRDTSRFDALSPAEKYEETCKHDAMASAMARSFLRQHLNIVDTPKFEEWNLQRYVKPSRNATNDCLFTVEGQVTFKNEAGGQSRALAHIVVAPLRANPDRWSMLSIYVR